MPIDDERLARIHEAVADVLLVDPDAVLGDARATLTELVRARPTGMRPYWLDYWRDLLDTGPIAVIDALIGRTDVARALRANSPFA
ncbi:MAG TPA: hypothetical protein VHE83_02385 [Mycobacteriales bacterium]|nr:hypothetical protein [Mycobacteriales bacterium]